MGCGFFDQSCNLLWPGDVDRLAGVRDFDLVTVGSCGIPPLEVGVMVLSAAATNAQLGLFKARASASKASGCFMGGNPMVM